MSLYFKFVYWESIELKIVNSTSWEAEKDYPPNVWASTCLSGKTGLCESSILCNLLTVFETEGKSSNFNLNRIKYLINDSFKIFNKNVLQREKVHVLIWQWKQEVSGTCSECEHETIRVPFTV